MISVKNKKRVWNVCVLFRVFNAELLRHPMTVHGAYAVVQAEQVSFAAALDVIIIVVLAAIWAVMPTDGLAIITQWFYDKVMQVG